MASLNPRRVYINIILTSFIYLIYVFVNSNITNFALLCNAALKSPMLFNNFNLFCYHNVDSNLVYLYICIGNSSKITTKFIFIMMYKLTLDVSIEEFKILREAVSSYRCEVFDDELCDGDVYPGGHPTEHYDQVDRVYHFLEHFKDNI